MHSFFFRVFVLLAAAAAAGAADFENTQAARLVIGQTSFTAESPIPAQGVLGGAAGVAVAGNYLFVADANRIGAFPSNHRVLIYQGLQAFVPPPQAELAQGSNCPACVGMPNTVLGQPDFTTTTPGLQAGLNNPTAVASDGVQLAVADTDNNRVLIWKTIPTGNNTPPDVVLGQPDLKSNAPATSQTGMRGPQGVWFYNGKLIVCDTQNGRVLVYNSVPGSNGAKPDLVLGQPDFNTRPAPDYSLSNVKPTASSMLSPVSATTAGNKLIVTDIGLNRVLIFSNFPASNNAPADLVLGQPDFNSLLQNNSSKLCASNGTDSNKNPTYPARCMATLSFPRFALSDGNRLFIADGGNDRVLVYSNFPTQNGAAADILLGQNDPTLLDDSETTDSASLLRTPSSLAWDGTNLYVADPFNRRILVFTPGEQMIASGGIVNAASFEVHAQGTVTLSGSPKSGDTVTVTVNGTNYAYTVNSGDTLQTVRDNLVEQINNNPGDPNVYARGSDLEGAYATGGITFGGSIQGGEVITITIQDRTYTYTALSDDTLEGLVFNFVAIIQDQAQDPNVYVDQDPATKEKLRITARYPGEPGNNIAYTASVSRDSITAAPDGATLSGGQFRERLTLVARGKGAAGNSITLAATTSSSAGVTATASGANLTGGNDGTAAPPGTQIAIFGQNLAETTATADLSQGELPRELAGTQVYINGIRAPLYVVTPTQINAQVPFETQGDSMSVYVRTRRSDGTIAVSNPKAAPTPAAAPGLYARPGPEPRAGVVVHGSAFATGSVAINYSSTGTTSSTPQTVPAGIVVQIHVNGRTYQYTTVDGDTADSVRDTMVNLINAGNGDPDVIASAGTVGFLSARATVTLGGAIHGGDVATITINGRVYTYTVQASDNLATVANKLIAAINGRPDPDVHATLDSNVGTTAINVVARELGSQTNKITFSVSVSPNAKLTLTTDVTGGTLSGGSTPDAVILTARQPGKKGDTIRYSAFVPDGSAITATPTSSNLCCGNDFFSLVTPDNPAIPGETITVFGTGLGLTNPLPNPGNGVATGKPVPSSVAFNVPADPANFVSSLAGGKTASVAFVGLMPGQVGVYQINLVLNTDLPDDPYTPLTIAQGTFVSNVITFPVHNYKPRAANIGKVGSTTP
jgi:uncharacterized protein (TIGR03437 family)